MDHSISVNACSNCGEVIEPGTGHVCTIRINETIETANETTGTAKDFTFHGPIFGDTQLDQIIKKLDKILELLEISTDEEEDKILSALAKKGFFKQILSEAKLSSSSSDWQRELDEI